MSNVLTRRTRCATNLGVGALVHRVVNYSVVVASDCYYRYLFGRPIPYAQRLEERIHRWERGRRGDVPLEPVDWETQYRAGRWEMLRASRELGRYSVLAGYLWFMYRDPTVLDVGCGEGVLVERLGGNYRYYRGLDISEVAVEHARRRLGDERTVFVRADAERYLAERRFDVIVFNESLYYFDQPLAVFRRYARLLAPGGSIIVSMYHGSQRARAILRRLSAEFPVMDRTITRNGAFAWECCVFQPSAYFSRSALMPDRGQRLPRRGARALRQRPKNGLMS